jgi:hypothetical protein
MAEAKDLRHIVMFSGGIGSWATAKRVKEQHPADHITLLFSDVQGAKEDHIGEDEDTYRFIEDAARNVGAELVTVKDGRDIWQVFKDKRFLGNSRLASCSHELKQKPARAWLEENTTPDNAIVYVGIDWSESHRVTAIERNYLPWTAKAPMTEPPYLTKPDMIKWAETEGLTPPRLYALGFAHNNCGGGCVRAGQGQFKHLLDVMPNRFAVWERKEAEMSEFLGKEVTILKESVNGKSRGLTLTELRIRHESQPSMIDIFDIGGCGCFVDDTEGDNQ